jgi:hypothetical protein
MNNLLNNKIGKLLTKLEKESFNLLSKPDFRVGSLMVRQRRYDEYEWVIYVGTNGNKKNIYTKEGNKFGGGNFVTKLTGAGGPVGPNTTNVNGLGVVEGAPDYTLGVTPIISKEKKAKKLTAKDLLPKATKDDWFDMPYDNKQMMRIENENLIAGTATQARIGIDTQGQTLKNASHDLRAAPPNPKFMVSPWNNSTIEPDYNIKPIM